MTIIDGFLLTRQWRDTPQGIELEFWFSTETGPLCVTVTNERSVFFVAAGHEARLRVLLADEPGAELRPLTLKNFEQEDVFGVYLRSYRAARRLSDALRQSGIEPLESDVNPADRYLMERFITGSARLSGPVDTRAGMQLMVNPAWQAASYRPMLRVVSFDIETAMSGVQLYSIAVHGWSTGADIDGCEPQRRVFMCGAGAAQDYVETCENQGAVLQAFVDWVEAYDPDVLIGWNVINFDLRYLQRVADQLQRRLLLGRRRQPAQWREHRENADRFSVQLPGRVVLDGIELLRAAFYRFESFSLQNVATQLLGSGKLIHGGNRGQEISRQFAQDKTALAQYNLKDCELVSEIFQHTSLIDFALARSRMTGLNLDRMGGSVASLDNLYLPRLHRAGYVAPNASAERAASPGGFVLDSQPGLYEHVLVLDFKSLYPSIIRTFFVDPLGLALGLSGTLDAGDQVSGFAGATFAREGHLLPQLISDLWALRDDAKAAGDVPLSQAIKILMNSFYGVLGSPGCRFFDARLATSITRRGHDILQRSRDVIEAAGHRVIYGDTDSVFVWVEQATDDEMAQAVGRELQCTLNAWWQQTLRDEFDIESQLELEFETHYRRFLMPTIRGSDLGSKKRYAGVVRRGGEDVVIFKGLESVRTDWTRLARDFQEELYRRVFMEEPYETYIHRVVDAVLAGECDEHLVYRKRLRRRLDDYTRNVPPHVRAARCYRARDLEVPRRGDWVEYVITLQGPEPAQGRQAPLDYQHYIDKQLAPVADGILSFFDTSFAQLTSTQLGLFE